MGDEEKQSINRRSFVKKAGGALLGASASMMTARSYARILGSNDRIRLAQLGCGSRSEGHVHMVHLASKHTPVETVAVCDLWSHARERRAAQVKKLFGAEPRQYQYSEALLAGKDIDGVMVATGDFQHAKLLIDVVKANKDCYVEKPFANVLEEAKAARDAVKASKQVVQVGTQHRSQPYPLAVRDLIRSGRIGPVVHIEQEWNVNEERWRFRRHDTGENPEMLRDISGTGWKQWMDGQPSELREQDTDWRRWLLGKPYRPFNPHVYLEFRLYKDFSSGIFDQWLSHGSDLVHLWMDESYPESAVAQGGIFTWKDQRENPDTCVAAFNYPKGFLYTYKTTFGNSYRSFSRIQGRDGTIVNYGGEGASLFVLTKEGGRQEMDPWDTGPVYTHVPGMGLPREGAEIIRVPGAPEANSLGPSDDDVSHLENWLRAMRDRHQPNANVDHGFSHALAVIMAAQSYWSGKKVYWNPQTEEILDRPV
jgi:predicted dehydrogenase